MFGPSHYVPILRWKQAERFALRYLREEDRKRITPLIELTPVTFKSRKTADQVAQPRDPVQVVQQEAKKLLEACGNFPFFLDLRHVTVDVSRARGKVHALEYLAEIGRTYKLALVPVTGLSSTKEYQSSVAAIVKADKRGVCLRLTPAEILDAGFTNSITALLKSLRLTEECVHMLVDYEANDPAKPTVQSLLAAIPNLEKWQTLSVASGAFPPDLQGFELGNRKIPRSDWLTWKNAVSDAKTRLRKPSFSDYTIQYGLYKEPVEGCNPSVSVRYTLDEEWLVMRGDAVRGRATSNPHETRPGREQWHGHAQLLCEDQNLFYGESFSWGDAFIHEKSVDKKNHGSYEIWLRAGINHHMTVVSRQIASLHVA
jgi:Beta protein